MKFLNQSYKMKDILLFWPRFFREFIVTIKFYREVKSIQKEIEKQGIRVDWIGRMYTVVDLGPEVIGQPEVVEQSYVFQKLNPINNILMQYGLSDYSYPEISKIKGTEQYLVVLYPENDHFNFISFLRNFLFLGILSASGFGIAELVKLFL